MVQKRAALVKMLHKRNAFCAFFARIKKEPVRCTDSSYRLVIACFSDWGHGQGFGQRIDGGAVFFQRAIDRFLAGFHGL